MTQNDRNQPPRDDSAPPRDELWSAADLAVPSHAGDLLLLEALASAQIPRNQIEYATGKDEVIVDSDDGYRFAVLLPSEPPADGWSPGEIPGWVVTLYEEEGTSWTVGGTLETADLQALARTIVAWID